MGNNAGDLVSRRGVADRGLQRVSTPARTGPGRIGRRARSGSRFDRLRYRGGRGQSRVGGEHRSVELLRQRDIERVDQPEVLPHLPSLEEKWGKGGPLGRGPLE